MQADLFCQVVDHFGDIGVTWRLAKQLSKEHHLSIRLWVDDLTVFKRIEPRINTQSAQQTIDDIDIRYWVMSGPTAEPYPIVITSFCCPLSTAWVQRMAAQSNRCWVELEYLSAESWVESHHGLSSQRPDGLAPTFFYPGFTARTAGLIRERHLISERDAWQADFEQQRHFLKKIGMQLSADQPQPFLISLFAYPHAPFQAFFNALKNLNGINECAVSHACKELNIVDAFDALAAVDVAAVDVAAVDAAAGAAAAGDVAAVDVAALDVVNSIDTSISINKYKPQHFHVLIPEGVSLPDNLITPPNVTWQRIPFLTQPDYDRLLWSMHLNIVRGEDSFVRALWAGKPMIWHIYRQAENTHLTKLAAWLAHTTLSKPVQDAIMAWSVPNDGNSLETELNSALQAPLWASWQQNATLHTEKLALLPDLASNLALFCLGKAKNTESG
jgi:hypothetical protein